MALPLELNTLRVRWLATEPTGRAELSLWRNMLDANEMARADRFRYGSDHRVFLAAHALMRSMLSEATDMPTAQWRYVTSKFGKPALASDWAACGLRFNLSHTRGLVVCALAYDEVGVDVEAADQRTDLAIADYYFAPEEVRFLTSTPPQEKASVFFRLWTLKEAFIKATGEGLSRPLDSFSFAFDPVRITFHPEREAAPRRDDPAAWQFIEYQPAPARPLALAVKRPRALPLRFDARAALPEELVARGSSH
jgi:4'-phosphopantetheinyl transferase